MAKNSTTFDRRKRLLALLHERPGIRVTEIAQTLDVSEGTIRNDLKALAEAKQLIRVRGGAVVTDDLSPRSPAFATRAKTNEAAKHCIARCAAGLVQDGDSILLDASTTVYHLARFLQDRRNLTVITNGLEVARELARNPSNTVILVGGVLRSDGTSVTGLLSEPFLKDLHIKTAFVSCSGFSIEAGLTEVDIHEARLKTTMIASAAAVVALIDSSKFGKVDLTAFARTDQISCLFVDDRLSPEWLERLEQTQVHLTLCKEETP